MNRKKSKVWRKELNQLRAISDVPWPTRRFRIAPTSAGPLITDRRCTSVIGERWRRRRGWRGVVDFVRRRRPIHDVAICNQPLQLVPYDGNRRGHLVCPRCTPMRVLMKKQRKQFSRAIRLLERSGRRR